jgi:hypothetical protein
MRIMQSCPLGCRHCIIVLPTACMYAQHETLLCHGEQPWNTEQQLIADDRVFAGIFGRE